MTAKIVEAKVIGYRNERRSNSCSVPIEDVRDEEVFIGTSSGSLTAEPLANKKEKDYTLKRTKLM